MSTSPCSRAGLPQTSVRGQSLDHRPPVCSPARKQGDRGVLESKSACQGLKRGAAGTFGGSAFRCKGLPWVQIHARYAISAVRIPP